MISKANVVGIGNGSVIVLSAAVIIFIVIQSYLPSLENGFTNWDDESYVTECSIIKDISPHTLKNILFSYHKSLYKPLVLISFTIEYHFFKLKPFYYHLNNLILHLINCLMVFWLIMLLSRNIGAAFLISVLFGVHPMHVESVAWIVERKDLLYSLFYLLGLVGYCYFVNTRRTGYYFLIVVAYILSLMSKPQGITFPIMLFALDYLCKRKFDRKLVMEKVVLFVIALIFVLINYIPSMSQPLSNESGLKFQSPLWLFYVLYFYLKKFILPINLSCLYVYPCHKEVFISAIIIICLIVLIIISARFTRKVVFGSLFYLIALIPVLQIIQTGPSLVCDRYTYIPYVGLLFIMGELCIFLFRINVRFESFLKMSVIIVSAIIICVLSKLTVERISVWRDSVSLWNDALEKYYLYRPQAARFKISSWKDYEGRNYIHDLNEESTRVICTIYNNRGNSNFANRNYFEAIKNYECGLAINPYVKNLLLNCGYAYLKTNNDVKAMAKFNDILKFVEDGKAYAGRGVAYAKQAEYDMALKDFMSAEKLDPSNPLVLFNKGLALSYLHDYKNAIRELSKAIELDPCYADAYKKRGEIYLLIGENLKAQEDLDREKEFALK